MSLFANRSWSLPAALAAALAALPGPAFAQAAVAARPVPAAACPPLLDHRVPRLQDGRPVDLCQFAGKVVLVVNTASYCGFTPQFEALEALHARYTGRGLVVLGFPSNDFQQEDADAKKTADVCFNTYGVKFPMFATTPVRGAAAHPLFVQLTKATGQAPAWNFNKYLIGRDGKAIAHLGSTTAPSNPAFVAAVDRALAAK